MMRRIIYIFNPELYPRFIDRARLVSGGEITPLPSGGDRSPDYEWGGCIIIRGIRAAVFEFGLCSTPLHNDIHFMVVDKHKGSKDGNGIGITVASLTGKRGDITDSGIDRLLKLEILEEIGEDKLFTPTMGDLLTRLWRWIVKLVGC